MPRDSDLQAPWVGLSKEDYFHSEEEVIGYCSYCGEEVTDEIRYDGELVCRDCYEELKYEYEN